MNKEDKLFEGLDMEAADKLAADLDTAAQIEKVAEMISTGALEVEPIYNDPGQQCGCEDYPCCGH